MQNWGKTRFRMNFYNCENYSTNYTVLYYSFHKYLGVVEWSGQTIDSCIYEKLPNFPAFAGSVGASFGGPWLVANGVFQCTWWQGNQ